MAAKIDDFGPISQGYDRAQIGIAPPINNGTADVRPPENTSQRRQSLHVIISDNLPLLLTHPRRGFRRVKNAVGERKSSASSPRSLDPAPTLAPPPPVEVKPTRLHTEVEDKPKLPPVKALITNPVATVKSYAADKSGIQFSENLAKSEVPHSASVNLLLQDHENSKASTPEETAEGLLKLTQLKQLRQDAFVRWTVDRHVREVRKVQLPTKELMQIKNSARPLWTTKIRQSLEHSLMKHAQYYIDESVEWPHPSRKILASSFERIVVASTQLQNLYMDIRAISHWDTPRTTASYAVAYTLLVVTGHVPSIALLFLMYKVCIRRNAAPDLQGMWETVAFSEDRAQTPRHLNELIIQYGTEGWVDHAIERAGPALYAKLEHIADILEMIQNFYEWRDPFRTTITLCMLILLWLGVTVLPTWILVKASFFFMGFDFFVLSPVGYHYPKFRLLVSPFTWMLWKMPTHADWALARLQAEGREHLSRRHKGDEINVTPDLRVSKTQEDGNRRFRQQVEKIGTYECENEPKGILNITTASITFTGRKQDSESWEIQLCDLGNLQKISEPTRTSYSEGLEFRTTSGLNFRVLGLEKRDEIFSQVVGYSDSQWKRIK